jgi:CTP:molybdopterin cytidylyltransferase MocA
LRRAPRVSVALGMSSRTAATAARAAVALALAGDQPFGSRKDAERLRARLK